MAPHFIKEVWSKHLIETQGQSKEKGQMVHPSEAEMAKETAADSLIRLLVSPNRMNVVPGIAIMVTL